MQIKATTVEKFSEEARLPAIKMMGQKSILARIRNLVESTDWDEKGLDRERWLQKSCRYILAFCAVYFISGLILR